MALEPVKVGYFYEMEDGTKVRIDRETTGLDGQARVAFDFVEGSHAGLKEVSKSDFQARIRRELPRMKPRAIVHGAMVRPFRVTRNGETVESFDTAEEAATYIRNRQDRLGCCYEVRPSRGATYARSEVSDPGA
jgi:hypothetical protein